MGKLIFEALVMKTGLAVCAVEIKSRRFFQRFRAIYDGEQFVAATKNFQK